MSRHFWKASVECLHVVLMRFYFLSQYFSTNFLKNLLLPAAVWLVSVHATQHKACCIIIIIMLLCLIMYYYVESDVSEQMNI